MSGVNVKGMQRASAESGWPAGILAHIDVFGHDYTLACAVEPDGEPHRVRAALRDFVTCAPHLCKNATQVIIAPCLSSEALAACKEADAGFLDLEGNARLYVGEAFIDKRSFPCRAPNRVSAPRPGSGKSRTVPRLRCGRHFKKTRNSCPEKTNEDVAGTHAANRLN
jgi:hypothetical protein